VGDEGVCCGERLSPSQWKGSLGSRQTPPQENISKFNAEIMQHFVHNFHLVIKINPVNRDPCLLPLNPPLLSGETRDRI